MARYKFQSTLSLRRATSARCRLALIGWISIHALLAESDSRAAGPGGCMVVFQSTLSLRRATASPRMASRSQGFQSTLSLRRATIVNMALDQVYTEFQSTLSLRRATRLFPLPFFILPNFNPRSPCGERLCPFRLLFPDCLISIHALLAESDCSRFSSMYSDMVFQSTLSLRRATIVGLAICIRDGNFNPRSPCGERHMHSFPRGTNGLISIHALLAESDASQMFVVYDGRISIHALLAESDCPHY